MAVKLQEFISHNKYTWHHKRAFLRTEYEVLGRNTLRGYTHDMDKLLWLYPIALIFGQDKKWVQKKHRKNCKHHTENTGIKTRNDYIEMIIDWECARYTKPDKPMNAFQTMQKFYSDLETQLLPLLQEFGLCK